MNKVAYKYLEETYMKFIKNKRGSMKNIFKIARALTIFFVVFIGVGCTSTKYVHTSTPVLKTLEDPLFTASIELIKNDSYFFSLFKLTIDNKGDSDLEIDWNKTRYFHNKINLGGFVFEGIDPSSVKNGTIPNEIIAPKTQFSRQIAPFAKIAMAQRKDSKAIDGNSGLYAGLLPEGQNSIYLVMNHKGQTIKKIISVVIKEEIR